MMSEPTRRTVLLGAAWSVPVIAAAIATPLAAASTQIRDRLRFTNSTATVGKKTNTIYANTRVQVVDGPESVTGVTLVVTVSRDGETFTRSWGMVAGWQSTEQVYIEFPNIPKGDPVTITFYAQADGVASIVASVAMNTPGWWT